KLARGEEEEKEGNDPGGGDDRFEAQVKDQHPDPPVRGERLLQFFDRWFLRLDRVVARYLPDALNPFVQSGAIANTTFIIALISGFVLLIWYKPSVYQAYQSLDQIDPVGEYFRALHRYSSDACMLFILFHAFKMFFARRFGGARWLAWVTGIVAVALLWFDGWLGYWLVWDERANQIAVGTAKMLDQLPIFAEPLTRSFLTDDSFNSLLFFLVFFFHMLIPLAMGIALWLHVSRLNKANWITGKPMTWAVLGSLTLLSILLPADLTKPARMLELQEQMPIDYFYMLPLYFTDRLEGGLLWAIALAGFIGFVSVPWLLAKKGPERPKPTIDSTRCNGCEQCYRDCPFNAITMLPRSEEDRKKGDFYASIDPSKCISCGICVGSCDPVGIEFPRLPARDVRDQIDEWLEDRLEKDISVYVAYICSNSAGADLHIDEETGRCRELPGYIVRSIPCVGWVHPLMIERALRKGAEGVLIAGCQNEPEYRLGAMWTGMRIKGFRHPEMREDKVDMSKIHYLQYDRADYEAFLGDARSIQRTGGMAGKKKKERTGSGRYAMGAALMLILGTLTYFFSKAPYRVPVQSESELVVSFSLPGRPIDAGAEEPGGQQDLLPHMRGGNSTAGRERSEVRLRLAIDGRTVVERQFAPKGLFNDGSSSAIIHHPLEAGTHAVEIYLGDTAGEEWRYSAADTLQFETHRRRVVTFNRTDGFRWYPENR
ncbi:MAG: cytochrome b N-terminal domain-containing protein, partial [Balneolaceae bacterium]|nr:cytochrome b N-terminal domain-containing protein [Balneolaceae bacterium]